MHDNDMVHITEVIAAMVETEGTEQQLLNWFGVCVLCSWLQLKSEEFHAIFVMKCPQEAEGGHSFSSKGHEEIGTFCCSCYSKEVLYHAAGGGIT